MSENQPPICDYEGSDYQEKFWDQGERAYEDQVEAIALSRLLPPGGERLLEIGAGAGRHTPRYRNFNQTILLDYARSQLIQAKARLGASRQYLYVVGDVYRLPFAPGVFDAATMIRTFHHLADPLDALIKIRQVLKPNADFILEFANKRNLKAIVRWLLRRQEWNPFDLHPIEFARLNFDFHPRAVRQWLEQTGFSVARQLTVSHFRSALLKRWVPMRLLIALDSLAQWTGKWWQLSPSVFILAEAVGGGRNQSVESFWRCPACGSIQLQEHRRGLRCSGCDRVWGVSEGIYNFKEPISE